MKVVRHMKLWSVDAHKIVNRNHDGNGGDDSEIAQFYSYLMKSLKLLSNVWAKKIKSCFKRTYKVGKKVAKLERSQTHGHQKRAQVENHAKEKHIRDVVTITQKLVFVA